MAGRISQYMAVKFHKPFPITTVRQPANYSVYRSDDPARPIEMHRVRPNANLHGGDPKVEVSQVLLLPAQDLNPPTAASKLIVEVRFGAESSGELQVVWEGEEGGAQAPQPPPSDNELVNLIRITTNFLFGPLSAKIDVRSLLEGSHAPSFDFEVKYDLPSGPLFLQPGQTNFSGMWIGGMSLAAEGTYKVDGEETNIADHISASLNFNLLRIYRLPNPFTARDANGHYQGKLVYYAGLRLKGFELESDQDFEVVNWSVQPQLALWLPYSNLPGLWWARQMNIRANAATPLFVYLGYSFVDSLETKASQVARGIQEADRVELELAYAFPVTSRFRLGLRSRHFWLQQGHGQRNYQEFFARYYLNDANTTALLFKYSCGALPPTFERGEATGFGLSFDF